MKKIASIDYFRKDGDHAIATRTGGIVSILSVMVSNQQNMQTIAYLAHSQWRVYLKPNVSKDTFVQVDIHKGSEFVDMNIDLIIPKAPCAVLDVIVKTGYSEKVNAQIEGLNKVRIDRMGQDLSGNSGNLADSLRQQEGCRIMGKAKLHKVPSTLFITTESHQWSIGQLMNEQPELAQQISLAHYFKTFSFGNFDADLQDLKARFADYPEHLKFDMSTHSINRSELDSTDHYLYFKFCKLVAHSYVDELDQGHEKDFQMWQYSLTQNKKILPENQLQVQYISAQIEFSPLTMKITKTNNSLSKFLISLCGIVGGVFVIFGMLNSAVQNIKRQIML